MIDLQHGVSEQNQTYQGVLDEPEEQAHADLVLL